MIDKIQFRRSSKGKKKGALYRTIDLLQWQRDLQKRNCVIRVCALRQILLLKKEIGILDPVQTEVHANDIIWK